MVPNQEWKEPSLAKITEAGHALAGLVDAHLPERFYVNGEPLWRVAATALTARIAGQMRSVLLVAPARRPSDTLVLVRSLYEHVVTVCWLLIDPGPRTDLWGGAEMRQQVKLHRDAARFGIKLLTDDQLERWSARKALPSLADRAAEVDDHYGGKTEGFRAPTGSGTDDLLSIGGLYVGLYRMASRPSHASAIASQDCIDATSYPWRVRMEDDDDVMWPGIAAGLFAQELMVMADRFQWIDASEVMSIIEAMYAASN